MMKFVNSKFFFPVLSIISGLLFALGWPTYGFPIFLFVAFVPLLIIEYKISDNRLKYGKFAIFKWVLISFLIWNFITTWWIWNSTEAGAIMAVVLNSIFMATTFTLFHLVNRSMKNNTGVWTFIVAWIAFEYLHLNWNISWPWLNLGNGLAENIKLIQWYEYTGALGGTFWILSINLLIFIIFRKLCFDNKKIKNFKRSLYVYIVGLILIIFAPITISLLIYKSYKLPSGTVEVIALQPNNDPWSEQYEKDAEQVTQELCVMSDKLITDKTKLIVGPESVLYDNLWENNLNEYRSIEAIKNYLRKYPQCSFIIGASTSKAFEKGEILSETARYIKNRDLWYDAYNTALLIDTSTKIQLHHKTKLVIGPEMMIFQSIMKPIQEYVFDLGGVVGSLGTDPFHKVFDVDNDFKAGVGICYESVYGEFMAGFVKKGAQMLCVITNDGWWGNTQGHKQHLSFSNMRAIETRRDIVRSANTGISCFVNQLGEIRDVTDYWTKTEIKSDISLNDKITFYAKFGDYIGRFSSFCFILMMIISVAMSLKNRTKNSK